MVNLLNRDPPGRLSCIHALLRSLSFRFKDSPFTGEAAKHIVGGKNNPIEFCTCAKTYSADSALISGEEKYCPFLKAGSSRSYCYLVNSNELDTQKSKAVGAAILALEALGLCSRKLTELKRLEKAKLNPIGMEVAKYDFSKPQIAQYYEREVLNYGPAVGFLHLAETMAKEGEVDRSTITMFLGRPNNFDRIRLSNGQIVVLNDGDAIDARTRTTGALQAWLTYTGFVSFERNESISIEDVDHYYSNARNKLGYSPLFINEEKISRFFAKKPTITRPLTYDFYIKGIGTAREYSQRSNTGVQLENQALKQYGDKVRNRRLLLMFAYASASQKDKRLNLKQLAKYSNYENSPYVIDSKTHEMILKGSEADFLIVAGAPFLRDSEEQEVLIPRVKLDAGKLSRENLLVNSELTKLISSPGILI